MSRAEEPFSVRHSLFSSLTFYQIFCIIGEHTKRVLALGTGRDGDAATWNKQLRAGIWQRINRRKVKDFCKKKIRKDKEKERKCVKK